MQKEQNKALATKNLPDLINSEEQKTKEPVRKKRVLKHKMTEYAYLLQRKALRMMRKYYKDMFEATCK